MKIKTPEIPVFKTESEEADWWASSEGRAFVTRRSNEARESGLKPKGSALVARMNNAGSQQIALRLPKTDLTQARALAERKGIGYQTLLKMLVHEGLAREAQRLG